MFGSIANRYDVANQVLSGGIHHLWRRALVEWAAPTSQSKVLDCATGTGDLAIEFAKHIGSAGLVVGTDFCTEMLEFAAPKAQRLGIKNIEFKQADVTQLQFEDRQFDTASISFGIRNVQDPVKGLSELARVVRPGGVVLVLEFGQPSLPVFKQLYQLYSTRVLPKIGGWITGQTAAYSYLQDSSRKFPHGEEFLNLMRQTGRFAKLEMKPLNFGIAYLYKGWVKE